MGGVAQGGCCHNLTIVTVEEEDVACCAAGNDEADGLGLWGVGDDDKLLDLGLDESCRVGDMGLGLTGGGGDAVSCCGDVAVGGLGLVSTDGLGLEGVGGFTAVSKAGEDLPGELGVVVVLLDFAAAADIFGLAGDDE